MEACNLKTQLCDKPTTGLEETFITHLIITFTFIPTQLTTLYKLYKTVFLELTIYSHVDHTSGVIWWTEAQTDSNRSPDSLKEQTTRWISLMKKNTKQGKSQPHALLAEDK